MNRHFLFAAFVFSYMLLQNINLFAQTGKIEGTNITFTLPSDKWVLKVSERSQGRSTNAYIIEPAAGSKEEPPTILILVEKLFQKIYGNDYFLNKISAARIKPAHFYDKTVEDGVSMPLLNGRLCKGFDGKDSVYFACDVQGLQAVMILCSSPQNTFPKYIADFKSFLGSLKYGFQNENKPNISNTKSPSAAVNDAGNSCSYFPVVNGMKFTYMRKDMTGEHTVVESYTVAKDKTLKSGKVIKGYKINTTVANRNNTIIYYYCEDGSVKMYSEMPAYNTYIKEYEEDYSILPSDYNKPDYKKTPIWETEKYGSGKYLSFTELKDGGEGTEWTDRQVVNNNPVTISSEITETALSLSVRGKTYSPVLHVERTVTINYLGEDMELNTQDIYYAKGVGKIKVVEKGKDLLMGNSFTTTQELVSYNIPVK